MRTTSVLIALVLLLLPLGAWAQEEGQPAQPSEAEAQPQPQPEGEAAQADAGTLLWRVEALWLAHRLGLTAGQLSQLVTIGEQQAAQWQAMWNADDAAEGAMGQAIEQAILGIWADQAPSPDFMQALGNQRQADEQARENAWVAILYGRIAALQALTADQQQALGVTAEDFVPPEQRLGTVTVSMAALYQLADQILRVRDMPPPVYDGRRLEIASEIAAGLVPQDAPAFGPFRDAVLGVMDGVYGMPQEDFNNRTGGQWVGDIKTALNLTTQEPAKGTEEWNAESLKDRFFAVLEAPMGYGAWADLAAKMSAASRGGGSSEGL